MIKPTTLVLLVILVFLLDFATPAFADPAVENDTVLADVTLPIVEQRALGVLTLVRRPEPPLAGAVCISDVTWSFVGTVNGVPASGKGFATQIHNSGTSGSIFIDTVAEWNSTLGAPAEGSRAPFLQVGNVLYLGDAPATFPVALSQPMECAVAGANLQFTLTNVGAGPAIVERLAPTGDATPILPWHLVAVIGGILLILGLKLPLPRRKHI